jgi:hypothetical protein
MGYRRLQPPSGVVCLSNPPKQPQIKRNGPFSVRFWRKPAIKSHFWAVIGVFLRALVLFLLPIALILGAFSPEKEA